MAKISSLLRSPFSFLFARSSQEDRVAAYIMREHDRGRDLADILDDPYVRNRCSAQEAARVLERPDLIRALGEDAVEAAKQDLPAASA